MRAPKPIPQELLGQLVYDPTSATFLRWKEMRRGRRPGLQAGTVRPDGYSTVMYDGVSYLTHRVTWCLHHGDPGGLVVDHIDGNPANGHLENLQAITSSQNHARAATDRGYTFDARRGKFQAYCGTGPGRHQGYFDTEEEARAAYLAAKAKATEGLNVTL